MRTVLLGLAFVSFRFLWLPRYAGARAMQPAVYFILFNAMTNQCQDGALSRALDQCGDWPPGGNSSP